MEEYLNILAFLVGISTTFFTIFSLRILFYQKERTRFQLVLGSIMAICAISCLKDLVLTFPGMYRQEVLNWVFVIDASSALSYTVFVFEVVIPRWTTINRLILLSLPFASFTLLYILWPCQVVIHALAVFLWCYGWTVVIIGWLKVKRHIKYVRANFSNIDRIDTTWLKPVFAFCIVSQLAWLFSSLYATMLTDIIYYISFILLWLMVLRYSWNFRPIAANLEEDLSASAQHVSPALAEGALESLMEEQRLYLNKNLTLADLAQALNTNRTYVSQYLSQVRGQTFYDYINQLRIQQVSIPMLKEHPEYTLEYVASQSGFASISTFRRAFLKFTGLTPRLYAASDECN